MSGSAIKKYTGDADQGVLDSAELIRRLAEKFSVYVILRGYTKGGSIAKQWADVLGEQRVLPFENPRDVVEVLIGIVAGELGEFEDFEMRSSKRHSDRPDRVSRVSKSLRSVKEMAAEAAKGSGEGKSVSLDEKSGGSKTLKSKKLA